MAKQLLRKNLASTGNIPKRDVHKYFSPLPNEVFTLGLNAGEIAVYSYLLYCENRKTYQCYPRYKTIGKAVGMSVNTVRKYITSLESKHLISTEPTQIRARDGRLRNGSLLYTISPIRDAIAFWYDQQMNTLEKTSAVQQAIRQVETYNRRHPSEPLCASHTPQSNPTITEPEAPV